MRFVKAILIGLGACFLALILLVGTLLMMGQDFKADHEEFVRQFITDYSEDWDIRSVHAHVTNDFLVQLSTPAGQEVTSLFRRLGPVREIANVSVDNFFLTTGGSSASFTFKATFEHGVGLVAIRVVEVDGFPQVSGVHVAPSGDLPPERSPEIKV